MRIVADASFCAAWILPDEASVRAERILAAVLRSKVDLWVPSLWIYEMTNLLLVACRRGRIEEPDLLRALVLLGKVSVTQCDVPEVLARERIARLALRFDLSGYDAAYLELADRLRAPLHTEDRALRKAARTLDLTPA